MATRTRIYKVTFNGTIYLASGYSRSQAVEYIVTKYGDVSIEPCKHSELVKLIQSGIILHDISNVPATV